MGSKQRWDELGKTLSTRLPSDVFERLVTVLQTIKDADLADVDEGIQAMHQIVLHGRADLEIHELLALIENRVREARGHAARLTRRVNRSIRKPRDSA
jgi:hypothetical protein